jgi:hypothetical protein
MLYSVHGSIATPVGLDELSIEQKLKGPDPIEIEYSLCRGNRETRHELAWGPETDVALHSPTSPARIFPSA